MIRVGALFDSVSKNTGDESMGIALDQLFKKYKDINIEIMEPNNFIPEDYATIIVGGGQLIRKNGDPYYDLFRLPGNNILTSVGILPPVDHLDYLKEYSFISARTKNEADALARKGTKVAVTPCLTTAIKHDGYEYKIEGLVNNEPVVGVHVVPYTLEICPEIVEIVNQIPHKKVFIPFTHYNEDKSFMESLPFDMSNAIMLENLKPLELHSVISQMTYVIVSSLHATIFAYSQNIPFASLGQKKAYDYFKDRELEQYIFDSPTSLQIILDKINTSQTDYSKQIQLDMNQISETIEKYAEFIYKKAKYPESTKMPVSNKIISRKKSQVYSQTYLQQMIFKDVVRGRDSIIKKYATISNNLKEDVENNYRTSTFLVTELSSTIEQMMLIKSSRTFLIGSLAIRPWHIPGYTLKFLSKKIQNISTKRLNKQSLRMDSEAYHGLDISSKPSVIHGQKVAIVLHLYYVELWEYFRDKLSQFTIMPFDLYVSVPQGEIGRISKIIKSKYPNAVVYPVPNRGRDVLPFIYTIKNINTEQYTGILKLHSKKSKHREDGSKWLESIVDNLIPSNFDTQIQLINKLKNKDTGIIGPKDQYVTLAVNYEANKVHIRSLLNDIFDESTASYIDKNRFENGFFAGTMFWATPQALKSIVERNYTEDNFEREEGQIDSTFAHALERMFCVAPQISGYVCYEVNQEIVQRVSNNQGYIPSWSDLYIVMNRHEISSSTT